MWSGAFDSSDLLLSHHITSLASQMASILIYTPKHANLYILRIHSCPRCGLSFEDISNGERWTSETTHMHLMSCTDTEKQQANKAKKAAVVAKEAKKEKVSLKSRISLV